MINFLTTILTLNDNLKLIIFFITLVIIFTTITKDFKTSSAAFLKIALVLAIFNLI